MTDNNKPTKNDAPAFRHSIPVQMRFNDIDVLNHVNNSVYFSYYDLGKSAYFTTIKRGVVDWDKIDVVVANVNCNFIAPIYFGEPVTVVTRVEAIFNKSFKLHQRIINSVNGQIKSECSTIMVSIDSSTGSAVKLSPAWIAAITAYEGHNLLESHPTDSE